MSQQFSKETIEALNRRAQQLNSDRHRSLGARDSAKAEFERQQLAYKAKYGVDITPETLQAEYNKVYAEVQGNFEVLQENIQSIETGEYKNNAPVVSFDATPDVAPIRPQVSPPQQEVPSPEQKTAPVTGQFSQADLASALAMQATPTAVPTHMQTAVSEANEAPAPIPTPPAPVIPDAPDIKTGLSADFMKGIQGFDTPKTETLSPSEVTQGVQTPKGWGSPVTEQTTNPIDTKFNSILGG